MEDFSSTVGVVALVGCALAALALLCCARARCCGCGACAPRSARCSGPTASATSSRTAPTSQDGVPRAARLRPRRRRAPGRPARRRRGPPRRRDRALRARALRRLQRDVRPPVDVDRAARLLGLRDRPLLDPPPRPGAPVRQARAGRPRRAGALPRGGGGRAPRARRDARRATSVPPGTSRRRRRCGAPGAEPVAVPHAARHDRRRRRRRGRARGRADRELARGQRRRSRSTRSPARDDVTIVGELVLPIPVHLVARGVLDARRTSSTSSRTRSRSRSAPASCAAALPQARDACRRARPPRRCAPMMEARARAGRRSAPRRAAELYGATSSSRRTSTTTPSNATRFVWVAPRAARPAAARRPDAHVARVLGPGRRRAGLARALPVGVRLPRREPHEDRVAAAAQHASATTASSSTATAALASPAVREAVAGLRDALHRRARPGLLSAGAPSRLTRAPMADLLTPPGPLGSVPLTDPRHGPGDAPGASRGANGRVLVLNATYEPINVCTVRRAVVLLLKEKAEVIEHASWELRSETHDARAADGHPARDVREGPARHAPAQDHAARRLRARRLDSASTAARRRTSPSTTSSRAPRAGPRRGRTSSRPARRATAARATACRAKAGMHPARQPRVPHPQIFIHVARADDPGAVAAVAARSRVAAAGGPRALRAGRVGRRPAGGVRSASRRRAPRCQRSRSSAGRTDRRRVARERRRAPSRLTAPSGYFTGLCGLRRRVASSDGMAVDRDLSRAIHPRPVGPARHPLSGGPVWIR